MYLCTHMFSPHVRKLVLFDAYCNFVLVNPGLKPTVLDFDRVI